MNRDALIERTEGRFWRLIGEGGDDECWPWLGPKKPTGYGLFKHSLPGYPTGTHAHRFAYEQCFGPISDGLEIDHLCRNRACCNPAHLEAVTHDENLDRRPR